MARLYVYRIIDRAITILDVPKRYRDAVMALLPEHDRARMQALLDGEE